MQNVKEFLKRNKKIFIIIFILIIGVVIFNISKSPSKMSYTELVSSVEAGKIESITLDTVGKTAEVKFKDEENIKKVVVPSVDSITELLTERELKGEHITFEMKEASFNFFEIVLNILPIIFYILLFGVLISNFKSMKGGNNTNIEVQNNMTVKFDDVAGIEPQKSELTEIVDFLKNPKKYREIGAKIPKGVLLTGEPGTGKTLLAKAVAGEAGVSFFNMNGSEFEEMFVGLGASRVRKLFEKARKSSPSIVFIDEIDALGGKRNSRYNYSVQTLNQLLVEMDGFEDDDVVIIAATNREDSLDTALLRPGRFDRKIYIPKPDIVGREEILKIHAKERKIGQDVNLREIAAKTAGYTGAELANVINESAIIAVRNDRYEIMQDDINEALRKQLIGIAQKGRVISDKIKDLVSYHEAGHAIVSEIVGENSKVVEISMISRGKVGGYTMYEDSDDNIDYLSKTQCLSKISSLLAGRAAEKLILNDVSTGSQNDLERATNIATLMVTKYGMSDTLGPMALTDEEILSLNKDFTNPINQAIRMIIDNCNDRAEKILQDNIDLLHSVAGKLKEKETISGDEFRDLVKVKKIK